MKIKNYLKLSYVIIFLLMLIVFLLFFPLPHFLDNNTIIYHSIIDIQSADYGLYSALTVGLMGLFTTIFTNDKNLSLEFT